MQAQNRLHRWIETFGHTAPNNGFTFKSVGVITGKRVETKKKKRP